MRPDEEIKRNVEAELHWDPELDASDVAVTVKDGVVTLAGRRTQSRTADSIAGYQGNCA